ncbi:dihydrofolate reductase [Bacillus sp. FJAT-22090]|uniref:dihydrofolate reductase n=1 Tax=Bacillus sp. FJAT-22090 TaxID=1581038 RepID=UPI0011A66C09|nr:dihydrofolate reductase [Bacillus sp. FJAT-22090]
MISLIVAHDPNRVIGLNNKMPWHIPGDLAYFKEKTMNKGMVMGRKTFESIGRILPGRKNIIVTRNPSYKAEGAEVVTNLTDAINMAEEFHPEVMIIGGEQIFREVLPIADRLYVTLIQQQFEGDTFFPTYNLEDWDLVDTSEEMKTPEGTIYSYLIYDRKKIA